VFVFWVVQKLCSHDLIFRQSHEIVSAFLGAEFLENSFHLLCWVRLKSCSSQTYAMCKMQFSRRESLFLPQKQLQLYSMLAKGHKTRGSCISWGHGTTALVFKLGDAAELPSLEYCLFTCLSGMSVLAKPLIPVCLAICDNLHGMQQHSVSQCSCGGTSILRQAGCCTEYSR